MSDAASNNDIAIIGMAGRFPGADDVDTLWNNLCQGVESVRLLTPEEIRTSGMNANLEDPDFVKASSLPNDIEYFDASFFNISPREAELMDPQHRLFLESAWQALEQAGYVGDCYDGAVGVYGGATINTYLLCNLLQSPEAESVDLVQLNLGNSHDFLTTRVSYKLNLTGPSHSVQSACSTSLVAVHQACQSILHGECDMALAGGVSINLKLRYGYKHVAGGMTSPDGHCRAFDKNARGTIFGGGVGIVVLKKAETAVRDGDSIYALIKGSAVNNDGSVKVGYTAPGVSGQTAVIREALANAAVDPDSVSYVETHGTGTALGDPIEIQALANAFRTGRVKRNSCGIGSVKTNLGHLDAAAGVTGLIKTALALKNKRIPATLHFESPNPEIDFENTPFYVVPKLMDWKCSNGARRAGVSAFGVGGTNAHVVLGEAPETTSEPSRHSWHLLVLSARSEAALQQSTDNLVSYLKQEPAGNLADVAYTLQVGRRCFPYRRVAVCSDSQEGWRALHNSDAQHVGTSHEERQKRPVAFLFPGQGAQYVGMAKNLYQRELVFRTTVEYCSQLLKPDLGLDLKEVLYPRDEDRPACTELLNQTWLTQPALFVVEYALARLLRSWGVHPEAMLGHSIGEYVAACIAGVFSLEDGLKLVAFRARLMQSLPRGAMLAAGISEGEAETLLGRHISLAAVNGPMQCVLSGEEEAITELEQQFHQDGVTCRRLQTSHAFHSHMVEPILEGFAERLKRIPLESPRVRYFSNVTGEWITAEDATSPEYWVKHLRHAVRFSQAMGKLLEDEDRVLVEAGPGKALSQVARRQPRGNSEKAVFAALPLPEPDNAGALLGQLWLAGAAIEWSDFHADERRKRIALPTYPFERRRYWIEPKKRASETRAVTNVEDAQTNPVSITNGNLSHKGSVPGSPAQLHPRPKLKNSYVLPATELEKSIAAICVKVLGITDVGVDDSFFELGGDSLMALQVVAGLKEHLGVEVPVVSLYEKLTIRSLAATLQGGNGNSENSAAQVELEESREDRVARRKDYQQRERSKRIAV